MIPIETEDYSSEPAVENGRVESVHNQPMGRTMGASVNLLYKVLTKFLRISNRRVL